MRPALHTKATVLAYKIAAAALGPTSVTRLKRLSLLGKTVIFMGQAVCVARRDVGKPAK